jgi:cytochrome c2
VKRLLAGALAITAVAAASFVGCSPPELAAAGNPDRGALALREAECGACHVIPGVSGARGRVGPSLEAFGRRGYIAGQFPNDTVMLVLWIQDPPALKPTTAMPALGIEPVVALDMAAYLESLE